MNYEQAGRCRFELQEKKVIFVRCWPRAALPLMGTNVVL